MSCSRFSPSGTGLSILSFLVEVTANIFGIKDEQGEGYLVDKVLDRIGMKGTEKWTVQQAAELSMAAPTTDASLDSSFLSGLKDEQVAPSKIFQGDYTSDVPVDKAQLIEDVRELSMPRRSAVTCRA